MKDLRWIEVWSNGMCMVFDVDGNQVPELQGEWKECKPKIIAAVASKKINMFGCKWNGVSFTEQKEIEYAIRRQR